MQRIGFILAVSLLGSSPRAFADKHPDCKGMFEQGSKEFADKKLDAAATTFEKAYKQCGPGQGFLQAQGYVRAAQGKLEAAAVLYLREISEPAPHAEAFGNLEAIRDKLSAKTKAKIVALGGTVKAPVHVLGVKGEYSWARAFTCMGATKLENAKQSIASNKGDKILDRLEFQCPGATSTHVVFFDYGTDEGEEEYKRERAQIDAQKPK